MYHNFNIATIPGDRGPHPEGAGRRRGSYDRARPGVPGDAQAPQLRRLQPADVLVPRAALGGRRAERLAPRRARRGLEFRGHSRPEAVREGGSQRGGGGGRAARGGARAGGERNGQEEEKEEEKKKVREVGGCGVIGILL